MADAGYVSPDPNTVHVSETTASRPVVGRAIAQATIPVAAGMVYNPPIGLGKLSGLDRVWRVWPIFMQYIVKHNLDIQDVVG